jgi:hypothetical protein
VRRRHRWSRWVERSLAIVVAIGAALVILLASTSTLVNREVAWTSTEARPRLTPRQYADSTALFAAVDEPWGTR